MTSKDIINVLRDGGLELNSKIISDTGISGFSDDSRRIEKDFVFIAVKGLKFDGNDYIEDVVTKKGAMVISEKDLPEKYTGRINFVKVKNSRAALALLSSYSYGYPANKLKIIGVTGTKGKTTVVHLIYHILKNAGLKVGMISTVKALIAEKVYDTGLHVTNPDAPHLHKLLKEMVENGIEYAVVEVTSHGLDQERVYGINFDIGVLTNITKEHLDYHKTFSLYRSAKFKLFEHSKSWVLNGDDSSYDLFKKSLGKRKLISYSQKKDADLSASVTNLEDNLMHYRVFEDKKTYKGTTSLIGQYNLYNILAAISVGRLLGIDVKRSVDDIESFSAPEGRLERVNNNRGIDIYIDFAHTPDSLENLLRLLKHKKKGRLVTVFGCAGERDKKKRFLIGKISGELSDVTVITAEDPRSEDVLDICREIRKGTKQAGASDYLITAVTGKSISKQNVRKSGHSYLIIPDRSEAIYYSLNIIAKKGDTIVFCGKGHEKSMCYGDVEHPWSDYEEIKKVLMKKYNKTAVVLGAGRGKRLGSELPKVVQKLAGRPMLMYTINKLRSEGYRDICLVVGYKRKLVRDQVGPTVHYALQNKPLGTAHAAWMGIKNETAKNTVLVVNGDDSAFYKDETFSQVFDSHIKSNAVLTITGAEIENPFGLGRIIRDHNGQINRIVEEKNASVEERKINECNVGMYCIDKNWFMKNIKTIKRNIGGEYYITDLIGIAVSQKRKVNIFKLHDTNLWFGVNTPEQLAAADKKMRDLVAQKIVRPLI